MRVNTLRRIIIEFAVNHWLAGTKFFELKRKLLCSIGYEIGKKTKIVAPIYNTGNLKIGDNCWIGRSITIHGNGNVIIGNNCDLAPDIVFLTGGHRLDDANRRAGDGESYTIKVGDGVWIGARSTITKDTVIGNGSVIAACACVVRDVSENTLVGGVPAKVIREFTDECSR